MYNPQRFKSENLDEVYELMFKWPFATVVSVHEGKPFISHLPLTPKRNGDQIELIGHMARANPHSKLLAASSTMVSYQGAHTYITPKWYKENDVPTWNYSAAHVSGDIDLIEDYDGIIDCIKELTNHVEQLWPSGWEFFVPEDLSGEILTKSIVGFKIKVTEINFKRKLSQNRSAVDRQGVLKGLETREDDNSRGVLQDMIRLNKIT